MTNEQKGDVVAALLFAIGIGAILFLFGGLTQL